MLPFHVVQGNWCQKSKKGAFFMEGPWAETHFAKEKFLKSYKVTTLKKEFLP